MSHIVNDQLLDALSDHHEDCIAFNATGEEIFVIRECICDEILERLDADQKENEATGN